MVLTLSFNNWFKTEHAHDLWFSYMASQLIHVDDISNISHVTKH